MSCTLTKQFFWTKNKFDDWCEDRTDEYDHFRSIEHSRTMKKLNKQELSDEEKETYEFCDHHYHWRYYGLIYRTADDGQVQISPKSFGEVIFELCPDWVDGHEDEAKKTSFKAIYKSKWDKLHISVPDRMAFEHARDFHKSTFRNIIISGPCGYGKTSMAEAILEDFEKDGKSTYFITCERLVRHYIDASPAGGEVDVEAKQALLDMKRAEVTLIDDFGTAEREYSEAFKEQFKMFLDEHRGRRIITTNLNKSLVEKKFNDKIVGRLYENCREVNLRGKDFRRQ